eukprot:1147869-Amphidinium_carterae.1
MDYDIVGGYAIQFVGVGQKGKVAIFSGKVCEPWVLVAVCLHSQYYTAPLEPPKNSRRLKI